MKKIVPLFTLLLLVTAAATPAAPPPARGTPEMEYAGQSVDQLIAEFMREHDVPGMSVAIVQAPYITRATGFGVSDRERRTLVAGNTVFNIAGMKNAFTAVAVMQLVESGKLRLEDVRAHLLHATEYPALETMVEHASGQSYAAFIRKQQIDRLGLRHTFFASELSSMKHEGVKAGEKHRRFLQELALIDPTEPATGTTGGGNTPHAGANDIYASAYDISIWDVALAGDLLIKDPALRKMLYVPSTLANGRRAASAGAWVFPGHEGLMVTTGSGAGFSSLLSRFTKSDELVCVTLLANRDGLDLTQLARRIAAAHNAKLGPPAKAAALRVQQSPYTAADTLVRAEHALRSVKLDDVRPEVWEENGEVWIAAPDPGAGRRRGAIDAALLEAVSPD
jgi:CubicO group peptidase (beta-lactamase class C family)